MKTIIFSTVIAISLIIFASISSKPQETNIPANNTAVQDGKQIITINAKGGYSPRRSVAKANIPTIIRFETDGTFDCSSSVRIPSIDLSKLLPSTGETDIDIGSQPVSIFKGSCGMGMYPFEIEFQ